MNKQTARLIAIAAIACCILVAACGDDDAPATPEQALLAQFGSGSSHFSESGMRALLDFEDVPSTVTLVQLTAVEDADAFAAYEQAIAPVWANYGATEVFASRAIGEIVGERGLNEMRAVEFPNTRQLIDALRSDQFAATVESLFAATSDHAWVLGVEEDLPFEPSGGFFDPRLLMLDEEEALTLLAANSSEPGSLEGNPQPIIDMVVSDSPEPFYMVNLIDFYERANYADGRESDLSGEEANAIYGMQIGPELFERNSGPEILVPVSVVLTEEERQWEQAVIVRYASRDAFLNAFMLNPDSGAALEHKEAGVEETLVYATERRHRTPPEPASGFLFNFRYCEIVLPRFTADGIEIEIWGTQGLSTCPQADWDALDPVALAAENDVSEVLLNGPRFFIVDWISNAGALTGGETRLFGDLRMSRFTTASVASAEGAPPYTISRVARDNGWHFVAGRRIYELVDPDGTRYVMQSFSRIADPDLTLEELTTLGDRLELPDGWRFESRILTETLHVAAIDGMAEILQDDLTNTYQRVP